MTFPVPIALLIRCVAPLGWRLKRVSVCPFTQQGLALMETGERGEQWAGCAAEGDLGLFYLFFFNFIYLFIYLFMAVLGLHFCVRAFSSCGKCGPLFIAVRRPLTIVASPVAEHRLQTRRLSNCGSRA